MGGDRLERNSELLGEQSERETDSVLDVPDFVHTGDVVLDGRASPKPHPHPQTTVREATCMTCSPR